MVKVTNRNIRHLDFKVGYDKQKFDLLKEIL